MSNALLFSTAGSVRTLSGVVDIRESGGAAVTVISTGEVIPPASKISAVQDGVSSVMLGSEGSARMTSGSELHIPAADSASHSLELLKGSLFMDVDAKNLKREGPREFRLKTPCALLAVKGTQFFSMPSPDGSAEIIGVHHGSLAVLEPDSNTTRILQAGEAVTVSPGQISPSRGFLPEETAFTAHYAAARLLRLPFESLLNGIGVTAAPQRLVWSKLGEFKGVGAVKHLKPLLPQLSSEGILRYEWPEPAASSGKIRFASSASLYLDIKVGPSRDIAPLALVCRMRPSKILQARLQLVEGGSGQAIGSPFIYQFQGGNAKWIDCLIPFPKTNFSNGKRQDAIRAKKDSYRREFQLQVDFIPAMAGAALSRNNPVPGVLEFAEFLVLAIPDDSP